MIDVVNVIIFLAPLSGFDQMLEEDDTVNRLVRDFCYMGKKSFHQFELFFCYTFTDRFPKNACSRC